MTKLASIHLHPTAPLAPRVLLPGDPGRALLLAQTLLSKPVMFNHNRGLWGYSGSTPEGLELTIQSTGMGGPSAAIVISELADLGAHMFIRVGTCGALDPELALGDLLVVTAAMAEDGTSRALGADGLVEAHPQVREALLTVNGEVAHSGQVVSTDLFYDHRSGQEERWLQAGAAAVEMETATLLALAGRRRVAAGAVLLVSDLVLPERRRMDLTELREREPALGRLAVQALAGL